MKTPGQINNEILYGYGAGAKKEKKPIELKPVEKPKVTLETQESLLGSRSVETRDTFASALEYDKELKEKWSEYLSYDLGDIESKEKSLVAFVNMREKCAKKLKESFESVFSGNLIVGEDGKLKKEKMELQEMLNDIASMHSEFTSVYDDLDEVQIEMFEDEKADKATERIDLIRPETYADRVAIMRNYESNINSLEVEISALEMLSTEILSNPDSLQLSIYDAKNKDIIKQIESLDKIYKNDGFNDLNEQYEKVKLRFEALKSIDVEKFSENLG